MEMWLFGYKPEWQSSTLKTGLSVASLPFDFSVFNLPIVPTFLCLIFYSP